MKHLRLLILLPLLLLLTGSVTTSHLMVIARKNAAAGGGGYDIEENFEGTGYENTWTTDAGSPAPDTSTAGLSLEGSDCLYLNGETAAVGAYTAFTATDNVYVYGMVRFEDVPTSFRRCDPWGFGSDCRRKPFLRDPYRGIFPEDPLWLYSFPATLTFFRR